VTLIIASNDAADDFDHQFENDTAYTKAADKQHEHQTRYSLKPNYNALLRYYEPLHNQGVVHASVGQKLLIVTTLNCYELLQGFLF
jgi:hypothetical protein